MNIFTSRGETGSSWQLLHCGVLTLGVELNGLHGIILSSAEKVASATVWASSTVVVSAKSMSADWLSFFALSNSANGISSLLRMQHPEALHQHADPSHWSEGWGAWEQKKRGRSIDMDLVVSPSAAKEIPSFRSSRHAVAWREVHIKKLCKIHPHIATFLSADLPSTETVCARVCAIGSR